MVSLDLRMTLSNGVRKCHKVGCIWIAVQVNAVPEHPPQLLLRAVAALDCVQRLHPRVELLQGWQVLCLEVVLMSTSSGCSATC